ncbi:MAG: DsbA family protein [Panacagrimonas sp.]
MDKELIYIADPMCSWCWGFAPVSKQLAELIHGRADLKVLPGGLRTDTQVPLSDHEAGQIMHHWEDVAARTGQPFDLGRPLDASYVYNTGAACRALSWMARQRPQHALAYLHSLHYAFYVDRKDLKLPAVLAEYARPYLLDADQFETQIGQADAQAAFEADLSFVRRCGIEGFPSVLLRTGQRIQKLTVGYQPYALLEPHIDAWLRSVQG